MSTTCQMQFRFAEPPAMRLTALDRMTMRVLERLSKGKPEVWSPTKSISQQLGITIRAAQLRIDRLRKLGLVERVYDYSLNSRRALVLVWRRVTTCVNSLAPSDCAESTNNSALTKEPPLETPYRSELSEKREIEQFVIVRSEAEVATEVVAETRTTTNSDLSMYGQESPTGQALLRAGFPSEALRAPSGPVSLAEAMTPLDPATRDHGPAPAMEPGDSQRKATPAEVAGVVARVKRRFPQVQEPARLVKTLAKRLRLNGDRVGIQWVSDALDWAEHKDARSHFYLATTLEDWVANGHPGKPPQKRAPVQQNLNPPAPKDDAPTADDIAGLEQLVAAGGAVGRIAAANLARLKEAQRG